MEKEDAKSEEIELEEMVDPPPPPIEENVVAVENNEIPEDPLNVEVVQNDEESISSEPTRNQSRCNLLCSRMCDKICFWVDGCMYSICIILVAIFGYIIYLLYRVFIAPFKRCCGPR